MQKILPLKGCVQHYPWGGYSFIPDLIDSTDKNLPNAEYWLGAHRHAPSLVRINKERIQLDAFIGSNPVQILGQKTASRFGRLPFLFKVLDVREMLSIQVHPTKSEAEKGYAEEEKRGLAHDAPNRNYKDDNHKPEIMVALSAFWLLHGFRPQANLAQVLRETPEFRHLVEIYTAKGYKGLYRSVMEEPMDRTREVLGPLIERIMPLYRKNELSKECPDYWAAKAHLTFCKEEIVDKGIYSIYFFNIVKLRPGEAIFQDAGVPHAYLEGQNMELMANSDNVLRAGLTTKHMDVAELLGKVRFEATIPQIIHGELSFGGIERTYKTPALDFEMSRICLNESSLRASTHSAEIMFLMEGEAHVMEGDVKLKMKRGDSVFILADSTYQIQTTTTAVIYKTSVPQE